MPLPLNLITDIAGIHVGNAHDPEVISGVTVVLPERPAVAAVDVRGGAPGTRETDALGPDGVVGEIHGLVLSGGSAFGLDAAGAVQGWLAARGKGYAIGTARVPIVPQAILFDLGNGGDKAWGDDVPYRRLALEACRSASTEFALGSVGAGYGAATANLRGGLGSASACLEDGVIVGALVAANPLGSVTIAETPCFWAAPFEVGREFGRLGLPPSFPSAATTIRLKGSGPANTTIAVVATNARLDKAECRRLAIMAQAGMARAIYPIHSPLDGDTVFALATGDGPPPASHAAVARLGAHAANCLARAIARAVFLAAPAPPAWSGPPAHVTQFPEVVR